MPSPEWKTGDTWPPLTGTAQDDDGPVNLAAADALRLIIKRPSGGAITGVPTLVGGGTTGQWSYKWAATDLNIEGDYEVELEVTWETSTTPPEVETYPNNADRNPTITVTGDLD